MEKDNNITPISQIDAKEVEAAQQAAEKAEDLFVLKFKKPFSYEGVDYDSLSFDFDGLTGADSLAVENEMSKLGISVVVPAFSGEYLSRIAARACTTRIGSDALRQMKLTDYNKLRSATRNFLMRSEQ